MQRQSITVQGIVQGVGFRPFIHELASRLQLNGFIRNSAGAVVIEVEGRRARLKHFVAEMQRRAPPLSRIEEVSVRRLPLVRDEGFRIEASAAVAAADVFISPDAATCDDCLVELFNRGDRRYRYPFLNCTNCGPRLTIIQGAPYDRERTTMARFAMCTKCRAEYDDAGDRRFHAQPTACAECGPQLTAVDGNGRRIVTNDPLAALVGTLLQGGIGALKGLGGFHLVCDARDEQAVRELRRRKQRDERPLAVMVRDVVAARRLCEISEAERELLESPRRPIVILRRRLGLPSTRGDSYVCPSVAPGNPNLGLMLPYTPLHQLLIDAVGDVPLVMTSGNRSDEPIAYENDDAVGRLGDIADVLLTHDRAIRVRCDDSVTRIVDGNELIVRRSRGYAPEPICLPWNYRAPMLAVGGQLKGVFALGRGRHAILSHHLGDLDQLAAHQAFERDVRLYEQLFEVTPERIVHDMHPNYVSTTYAQRRAADEGVELLPVQHHHAHMAACMAEHRLREPVIGISFDGTGYGLDGAVWGGEFLTGDYAEFTRASHLRYVRMPGGDKAVREPWRMAVAHLMDAGCDPLLAGRASIDDRGRTKKSIVQMLERGFNSPWTSSAGRLFDAVAAIAGVRWHTSYEGQAAMELEWWAADVEDDGVYPFELGEEVVDTRPLIRAIADDMQRRTATEVIARRFHSTMVEITVAVCGSIRAHRNIDAVTLSGGVFLNELLTRETCARLRADKFRVFRHRLVPPGDGGLCLGQLAVAAHCHSLSEQRAPEGDRACALAFPAK